MGKPYVSTQKIEGSQNSIPTDRDPAELTQTLPQACSGCELYGSFPFVSGLGLYKGRADSKKPICEAQLPTKRLLLLLLLNYFLLNYYYYL